MALWSETFPSAPGLLGCFLYLLLRSSYFRVQTLFVGLYWMFSFGLSNYI